MKVTTRRVVDTLAARRMPVQMVTEGIGLGSHVSYQQMVWGEDRYVPDGLPIQAQVWAVESGGKRPRFTLADGTRYYQSIGLMDLTLVGQALDVPLDLVLAS